MSAGPDGINCPYLLRELDQPYDARALARLSWLAGRSVVPGLLTWTDSQIAEQLGIGLYDWLRVRRVLIAAGAAVLLELPPGFRQAVIAPAFIATRPADAAAMRLFRQAFPDSGR
jgi:hypothetical protein